MDITHLMRHLAIATFAWLEQQTSALAKLQCCLQAGGAGVLAEGAGGGGSAGGQGDDGQPGPAPPHGHPRQRHARPRPQGAPAALLRGHQGAAPHQGPARAGARHAAAAPSGVPPSFSLASQALACLGWCQGGAALSNLSCQGPASLRLHALTLPFLQHLPRHACTTVVWEAAGSCSGFCMNSKACMPQTPHHIMQARPEVLRKASRASHAVSPHRWESSMRPWARTRWCWCSGQA